MMRFWLCGALWVPAFSVVAQSAAPQYRAPAEDSTFIRGMAERVMPVQGPSSPTPPADPVEVAQRPKSAKEFLEALAGTEIYYREYWRGNGWQGMPAWLRIVITANQARVQSWRAPNGGAWDDLCLLSSSSLECVASTIYFQGINTTISYPVRVSLNAHTIMFTSTACKSYELGMINASGRYSWDDYQAHIGRFDGVSGLSGYYLQGGSYNGECSYTVYND